MHLLEELNEPCVRNRIVLRPSLDSLDARLPNHFSHRAHTEPEAIGNLLVSPAARNRRLHDGVLDLIAEAGVVGILPAWKPLL